MDNKIKFSDCFGYGDTIEFEVESDMRGELSITIKAKLEDDEIFQMSSILSPYDAIKLGEFLSSMYKYEDGVLMYKLK